MNDRTVVIKRPAQCFLFDLESKRFVTLFDGFIIGREKGDLVFLNDKLMSKEHCRFDIKDKKVIIIDLESSNGTTVNAKKIQTQALSHKDSIKIGNREFLFSLYDNLHELNAQASVQVRTDEIQKSLIKSYLIAPFKIRQYPLSLKIFLGIYFICLTYFACTDFELRHGLNIFGPKLFHEAASIGVYYLISILISLYVTLFSFFWIVEGTLKLFLKSKIIISLCRCVTLSFFLFPLFLLIIPVLNQFTPANGKLKSNMIIYSCERDFKFPACLTRLRDLADDATLFSSGHYEIFYEKLDSSFVAVLKERPDLDPTVITSILKLHHDCKEKVLRRDQAGYKKSYHEMAELLVKYTPFANTSLDPKKSNAPISSGTKSESKL